MKVPMLCSQITHQSYCGWGSNFKKSQEFFLQEQCQNNNSRLNYKETPTYILNNIILKIIVDLLFKQIEITVMR